MVISVMKVDINYFLLVVKYMGKFVKVVMFVEQLYLDFFFFWNKYICIFVFLYCFYVVDCQEKKNDFVELFFCVVCFCGFVFGVIFS